MQPSGAIKGAAVPRFSELDKASCKRLGNKISIFCGFSTAENTEFPRVIQQNPQQIQPLQCGNNKLMDASLNIWQVNFDIGILNSPDPRVRKKNPGGPSTTEIVTHSWPRPFFSNNGNKPPIFCYGTVKTPHFCLRILLLLLVLLAPELITSLANRTKPDFDFLSHHKTRPQKKWLVHNGAPLKHP